MPEIAAATDVFQAGSVSESPMARGAALHLSFPCAPNRPATSDVAVGLAGLAHGVELAEPDLLREPDQALALCV